MWQWWIYRQLEFFVNKSVFSKNQFNFSTNYELGEHVVVELNFINIFPLLYSIIYTLIIHGQKKWLRRNVDVTRIWNGSLIDDWNENFIDDWDPINDRKQDICKGDFEKWDKDHQTEFRQLSELDERNATVAKCKKIVISRRRFEEISRSRFSIDRL